MELLLNLLWLAISLLVCAAWQFRWRHDRNRRHSQAVAAVALACLVVLLFFPISLTDDLHADLVLASDVASKRKGADFSAGWQGHHSAHPAPIQHRSDFAHTAVDLTIALVSHRRDLLPPSRILFASWQAHNSSGRSPPASLA